MALDFDDDKTPHVPSADPDWRESYYCNFYDIESGVHGVAWQGVRPNAGTADAVFVLYDGPLPLIRSVKMGLPITAANVFAQGRGIGAQEFVCLEPWRHWQVRYDEHDTHVRLDWKQLTSVCDWDHMTSVRDPSGAPARHLQLAGHVSGEAQIGGRSITINGYGERDRAWGPRNYGALQCEFWNVMQFPDDVAAHAFILRQPDRSYRLYGYLHRDGKTRGLRSYTYEGIRYAPNGGPPDGGGHTMVDDAGRTLRIATSHLENFLSFATQADGASLQARDPGNQKKGRMFLSFQKFVREDGVVGRGMIDFNAWADEEPGSVSATAPPLYSTLYDYGLAGK